MPLTVEELDAIQRRMAEDIARAARAFGIQFTDREMVFVQYLALEALQQKHEHPSVLYDEEVISLAASKIAANA